MIFPVDKVIEISKTCLKFTGLWPSMQSTLEYKLRALLSNLITVLLVFTMAMELPKHSNDYAMLFGHLTIMVPPTSYLLKLIVFNFHKTEFFWILNNIDFSSYTDDYLTEKNTWGFRKRTVNVVFISKLYWCFCAAVIFLYNTSPLLLNTDLPVQFSYDLGNYRWLMYIFQMIGLANVASNNYALDVLASSLMVIAASQINILNNRITEFAQESETEISDLNVNKWHENLRKCVKHHIAIIRFIEKIERVFSIISLIQYITSGIEICYIGFQLVHVNPISIQFANMLFFFLAMTCELAMYCWYGNEIILESLSTQDACYNSNWTNSDITTRKFLLTIMERSKRPLYLTAGKFSIISLASFMVVMKTSYSYFALMQRLYNKQSGF